MNDLPIEQSKVKELIRQCKHLNVFPVFLNHYYPKTCSHPISDLLEELVADCLQYLKIMSEEEVRLLVEGLPIAVRAFIDLRAGERLDGNKLERIAFKYLVAIVQTNYLSLKIVVSDDTTDSEVLKIYPELEGLLDGDGLLYLDERFTPSDFGIEYKDHILYYHQFLRRGYTSNPNFDFLGQFVRYYYQSKSHNTFRAAIDHRRIMPKEFFQSLQRFSLACSGSMGLNPRYETISLRTAPTDCRRR